MENNKEWGQDAPQDNNRENSNEILKEPAPQYGRYEMHRMPVEPEQTPKKHKKTKRKKTGGSLAGTLALAVVFGVTASAVFQLSNMAGEKLFGFNTETKTETVRLAAAEDVQKGTSDTGSTGSVSQVAASAMPSVVAITSVSVQEIPSFFGIYGFGTYGTQQYSSESSGSGIIVGENDKELLIATNNHVVEGATTLSVCFIGNDVINAEAETRDLASGDINVEDAVSAKIKGTDATNDLAVVAVKKGDIPEDTLSEIKIASLGDSDSLQVGEQVVAIGNALGYGQSVTSGWVSALDRSIAADDVTTSGLIQTDAAINPGNSGGALLNMKGELIGINSAKYADNAVEGMGYAIPVSTASPILENLMNRETRDKLDSSESGYLGVRAGDMTEEALAMYNMPEGAFVFEALEGDAAANAGIQRGDVIVGIDGQTVTGQEDLYNKLAYYAAGETIEMAISRAVNGEYTEQTLEVTLGSRPDYQQ
nr:trypsin-like peptidase domain-containing protein [uncultured Blautia sp.]